MQLDPTSLPQVGAVGAAAAVAYATLKDLIPRVLGPTADYLGEGLKSQSAKAIQNLKRVFESAERKLGSGTERTGEVPARVIRHVISEAAYVEDALMAEYFGGVLASARSGISRDDRGARMAQIVASLSTYEVRSHYILYCGFAGVFRGRDVNLNIVNEANRLTMEVPFADYAKAMEFTSGENALDIFAFSLNGLSREGLILDRVWGSQEHLYEQRFSVRPGGALVVAPNNSGTELFLWAHGLGHCDLKELFNSSRHFPEVHDVKIDTSNFRAVSKRPRGLFELRASNKDD